MIILICVIGTQKGDNQNYFLSELLPLFGQNMFFSDKDPAGETRAPGSAF